MSATKTINGYEIIKPIAQGGMGAIYEAIRKSDGRQVAFKVMRADKMEEMGELFGPRFKRELDISKNLAHPYVVQILDGGIMPDGSGTYIVMEFIEGQDLRELSNSTISEATMRHILKQMAEAFSYIHHKGLVHRDVKMENILVDLEGRAVLVDFGLAYSADLTRMTATSDRPGTLLTMSPEQIQGEKVDGRSDIYSLGVTAYMALAGSAPYSAEQVYQIAVGVEPPKPVPLADQVDGISEAFSNIVNKCLELNRDNRFKNADELLKALEGLEYQPTITSEVAAQKLTPPVGKDTGPSSGFPDNTVAVRVESKGRFYLLLLALPLLLLTLMLASKKRLSPPRKNNRQEVLEWAKDLSTLRDELLLTAKIPDSEALTTLGELVHLAKIDRRLKINEEIPKKLLGLYYLARYCQQNKLWEQSRTLYFELVNNKDLSKEKEYGQIYEQYLQVTMEVATERQSNWPDSRLDEEWTDEAEAVRQLMLPVVHHTPVVKEWQRAIRIYTKALRYKETKEAKDEAIRFTDYCRQAKMTQQQRNTAYFEVAGFMTAYVGAGLVGNHPDHVAASERLTLEILDNLHTTDKDYLWRQYYKLIDVAFIQRKFKKANKWLQRAEREIPGIKTTYEYIKTLAEFETFKGNHTKAIEIIKTAKKFKISRYELSNLEKKIKTWHPYALLERARKRKK